MEYEEEIAKYRNVLVATQQKLNESYDKLIVALSGGALGLSLTFLKDLVNIENMVRPTLLLFAWAMFVVSIASVLGEILFGLQAHKKAISQIDASTSASDKFGGLYGVISTFLQRTAAITLVIGLFSVSCFVYSNMVLPNDRQALESKSSTKANASNESSSSNEAANPRLPTGEGTRNLGAKSATAPTTK